MWIDRVIELQPRTRIVTIKNISMAEEHLHDHFAASEAGPAQPLMPASLVVEGMAQSAGVLVGHAYDFREKVVLAKVNRCELYLDARPGFVLRHTATIVQMDPAGASTTGVVELIDPVGIEATVVMAHIDLMFSNIDQNRSGLEFPDHNFVFSEAFSTLLRESGIPSSLATP
jgi:3-hydroxyacyl-[acyl-carrier-protein] dehydratase